jgi:hypothetical protein
MANNGGEFQIGKVTDDGSTVKAEHMRITASGDIGFGTTTPDTKVQIKGAINSAQLILGGTDSRGLKISTFNQGNQNDAAAVYDAQDTEGSAVNSHHIFKTGNSERMRVNGNGSVSFNGEGVPSASHAGWMYYYNGTGGGTSWIKSAVGATSGLTHYQFINPNGSVGQIYTSGSSTVFATTSDYRLKENVDYTWDATTRLKQLKPARFNFIADPDTIFDGFLAHEAQSVVPECAMGTHNEVDDDGNAVYQGIDQSKLVPLLVKTIQELEARITALEDA